MDLSASAKRGYHHGDLRNALADAAAQLAQQGGPESVTVRAAARLVGVTPTAAYRHYTGHEELVAEAKHQCMERLREAMRKALDAQPPITDPLHRAMRSLAVTGRAYIDFALAEPGQFRTCFTQGGSLFAREHTEIASSPLGLLMGLLDELVALDFLAPERRPLAEVAAWSMTHGLAMLLLDGPLRDVPPAVKDEAITKSILIFARGLSDTPLSRELEQIVIAATRPIP
ncbi:MAG TPA: TetR-like C-terminal domain-containing protein [Actinophytocola sp.]|uniref:TetR-like C-terminal domain-containing protein n=1 Tax=Actinophytocola sp. TaxID=1872138 RepID=UPI002DDD80F3|nr:TetR-like C-terminal domain-containing protein [Actinophytocola sp.]HEV2783540.1 TetR-like C-terminal domain-containing protein [Actinophytocola sp.]